MTDSSTECRGIAFAVNGTADCAAVGKQCAYGRCTDSIGDHCYGIDPSRGYAAGAFIDLGAYSCPDGDNSVPYCPMAFDNYYTPDADGLHMCCGSAGLVMSCPEAWCSCYELASFDLSRYGLHTRVPAATSSTTMGAATPHPSRSSPTTVPSSSTPVPPMGVAGSPRSDNIALGVGIGFGLPATAAALFTCWWLVRRRGEH